jgi:hypothetical protein
MKPYLIIGNLILRARSRSNCFAGTGESCFGVLEYWSTGVLEYWSVGNSERQNLTFIVLSLLHYSSRQPHEVKIFAQTKIRIGAP